MSVFQEQPLPSSVATVASLSTSRARTANGAVIQTTGYESAGDGGGGQYIYRKAGRSGVTLSGFYVAGPGADDYFEATDKSRADIRRFSISSTNTAAENRAALQAALDVSKLVLLPNGTDISIDAALILPDDTVLKGEGANSIIRCTAGDINYFEAGNNCTIEGLHIVGPNTGSNAVFLNGGAVSIGGKSNVVVSDCFIEQFDVQGVLVYNGNNITIKNNVLYRNTYAAVSSCDINVYVTTTGGRIIIDGNYCLSNNSHGITLSGAGDDANSICVNNICITLDPLSCVTEPESVSFTCNAGTDVFTAAAHGFLDDQIVRLTGSDLPSGFAEGTDYYVIEKTDDTFKLSESRDGAAKDAVDAGSGSMSAALLGWQEIAPSRLERRHGILVGYSNSIEDCVISNNICQNLNWCGIYKDGLSQGPMLISNNILRRIGYADAGNESCIFITASGGEVVSGNICEDFQNVTRGAIYVTSADNNTEPVTVIGNTIRNSLGNGIYVVNKASFVNIVDNTIINSGKIDINIGSTDAIAGIGGHTVTGNMCHRDNDDYPSISLYLADSNRYTQVAYNHLRGFTHSFTANATTDVITAASHGLADGDRVRFRGDDLPAGIVAGTLYYVRDKTDDTFKIEETPAGGAKDITDAGSGAMTFTTPSAFTFNCGVYVYGADNENARIHNNYIQDYHYGIHHSAYWSGRQTGYDISGNRLQGCYGGISIGATTEAASICFQQNVFTDCDNDFSPGLGYNAGYNGIIIGGLFHGAGTAAPTVGTWENGDYYLNTNSGSLGPKGWFCSVAGSPGTWLVDNISSDGVQTTGDEDVQLAADRRKTVISTADLTANRTILLPPDANISEGDAITIRREGAGAFDLLVDSFAVLEQNEWIKVKHDGAGFVLDSSSTPLTKVFSAIVALAELEVWLNGDANTDTTGDANDVQGNHDATWVGTPAYGTKAPRASAGSKSLVLDGSTNYLTLPSAAADYTDDFSIAFWMKTAADATQGVLCYKADDPLPGGTGPSYGLSFGTGAFAFRDGSGNLFQTAALITPDTWIHVVLVINGADSRIYVDGVSRLTFSPTVLANTNLLRIGRFSPTDSLYFDGELADFMIYSKALAAYEAKALAIGP